MRTDDVRGSRFEERTRRDARRFRSDWGQAGLRKRDSILQSRGARRVRFDLRVGFAIEIARARASPAPGHEARGVDEGPGIPGRGLVRERVGIGAFRGKAGFPRRGGVASEADCEAGQAEIQDFFARSNDSCMHFRKPPISRNTVSHFVDGPPRSEPRPPFQTNSKSLASSTDPCQPASAARIRL